ncbi:hypothetical protein [Hyphomonas sp. UBA5107]|uniref:hypothetical protein n=1 Tax=uncultured Hyphomonas sp. TaxID=225298 RepID=UPI0025BF5FD4|nr:hypothetical protein [Hyphomonas sp. UBA5107]
MADHSRTSPNHDSRNVLIPLENRVAKGKLELARAATVCRRLEESKMLFLASECVPDFDEKHEGGIPAHFCQESGEFRFLCDKDVRGFISLQATFCIRAKRHKLLPQLVLCAQTGSHSSLFRQWLRDSLNILDCCAVQAKISGRRTDDINRIRSGCEETTALPLPHLYHPVCRNQLGGLSQGWTRDLKRRQEVGLRAQIIPRGCRHGHFDQLARRALNQRDFGILLWVFTIFKRHEAPSASIDIFYDAFFEYSTLHSPFHSYISYLLKPTEYSVQNQNGESDATFCIQC